MKEKEKIAFAESLGLVFEKYLNQDSGNIAFSIQTPEKPIWIKFLDLEKTALGNLEDLIAFYNSFDDHRIPKNWELLRKKSEYIIKHD